jgi:arginase
VWLDAHGDLNTKDSSPSGNLWGMPLRMSLQEGSVAPADLAHVGARSLDPPEVEYMAAEGIDDDLDRALAGADAVYVAFDLDVLAPGEVTSFMPEPGGPTLAEAAGVLRRVRSSGLPIAGVGFTGGTPETDPAALVQLAAELGL